MKVDFRALVFRPFRGEVLEGKISDANGAGLRVSLDFFDDVFIPGPDNLFPESKLYDYFEPLCSTS